MKLLRYNLGILLCLTAIFFMACESEEESIQQKPKPTIKFTKVGSEAVIAYPGTELHFSVEMTATAGIKRVVTMLGSQELPGSEKEYADAANKELYNASYTVKPGDVGKTLNFVILAYDSEEKKSTAEYTVYIQAAQPKIEIKIPDTAPEAVSAGETISFDIEITSEAALRSIKTYLANSEIAELRKETFTNPNSDIYAFSYQSKDSEAAQTLTFTFEVMDANGGIIRGEYSIDIERVVELDINEYYGVQIGAQASTDKGPYLNTVTGEVYEKEGSTAKCATIDLALFYSNSTYGYYFAAPSEASIEAIFKTPDPITGWTQRNATKMKTLEVSANDFSAINSKEEIETLYTNSSADEVSKLTAKLGVGSVVAFKTVAGKYGIILVKSFASGNSKGNITVDIKVEK